LQVNYGDAIAAQAREGKLTLALPPHRLLEKEILSGQQVETGLPGLDRQVAAPLP